MSIARCSGQEMSVASIYSGEAEYSISTPGLLCVLGDYSASLSAREDLQTRKRNAGTLLVLVCGAIVGALNISWFAASLGMTLTIVEGLLQLGPILEHIPCCRRLLFFQKSSSSLPDFFERMFTVLMPRSKSSTETKQGVGTLIWAVADMCGFIFDHLCPLQSGSAIALPTLRFATTRARRVSQAKKLDFRQAAATIPSIQNAGQMVACDRVLKRKINSSDLPLHSKTAKMFVRDTQYQYMLSSHEFWDPLSHVSCGLDGVHVGNDEVVPGLYFSTEAEKGNWAPPQEKIGSKLVKK